MKFLFFFISLISFQSLFGQDYFYNTYDPFDRELEYGISIKSYDENIFINCEAVCENNTVKCHKLIQVDLEGSLSSAHQSSLLDGSSEIFFEEEFYYIGGDDAPINQHFRLYKSTLRGDSVDFIQFEPEWRYFNHFQYGTYRYNDKILVFGEAVDRATVAEGGGSKSVGIVYVADLNLNLDTTLIFNPVWEEMRVEHMSEDSDGNLVVLLQGDFPAEFVKPRRKIIKKYNSEFEEVFHWESYDFFQSISLSFSSFDILSNGNIVIEIPSEIDDRYDALLAIDASGNEIWRYDFKHLRQRRPIILDLKILNDESILICGSIREYKGLHNVVPYIMKIDSLGNRLWERRYANYRSMGIGFYEDEDYFYNDYYTGFFADLEEDEDGNIWATGSINVPYTHPTLGEIEDQDVLVAKLDKDGCLEPDCSLVVTPGVRPDDRVVIPENRWIYEVTDANGTNPRVLEYKFDTELTVIKGTKYRQLLYKDINDEVWTPIEEYFREFGYTVWVYKDTKTPQLGWVEDIVYDFSVVPPSGINSLSLMLEITNYTSTLRDTVTLLNGEERTRLQFKCIDANDEVVVEWIDGIGSNRGHHNYAQACVSEDNFHELLCFSTDGETLWEHPTKTYCRTPAENIVDEENHVVIYPNPTAQTLHIDTDLDFSSISIFDLKGNRIYAIPFIDQIQTSDFPSGVYSLRLESKSAIFHKRFTVIK